LTKVLVFYIKELYCVTVLTERHTEQVQKRRRLNGKLKDVASGAPLLRAI